MKSTTFQQHRLENLHYALHEDLNFTHKNRLCVSLKHGVELSDINIKTHYLDRLIIYHSAIGLSLMSDLWCFGIPPPSP